MNNFPTHTADGQIERRLGAADRRRGFSLRRLGALQWLVLLMAAVGVAATAEHLLSGRAPTAQELRMAIVTGQAEHHSTAADGKLIYLWNGAVVVCEVDAAEQPSICSPF